MQSNIYMHLFNFTSEMETETVCTARDALHDITLHYITLHYITLHYITLHYITLHYITLHYIKLN